MRAINRHLKKVEFERLTSHVFRTCHGDVIVQWNSDPSLRIASYETQPLIEALQPDSTARRKLALDVYFLE